MHCSVDLPLRRSVSTDARFRRNAGRFLPAHSVQRSAGLRMWRSVAIAAGYRRRATVPAHPTHRNAGLPLWRLVATAVPCDCSWLIFCAVVPVCRCGVRWCSMAFDGPGCCLLCSAFRILLAQNLLRGAGFRWRLGAKVPYDQFWLQPYTVVMVCRCGVGWPRLPAPVGVLTDSSWLEMCIEVPVSRSGVSWPELPAFRQVQQCAASSRWCWITTAAGRRSPLSLTSACRRLASPSFRSLPHADLMNLDDGYSSVGFPWGVRDGAYSGPSYCFPCCMSDVGCDSASAVGLSVAVATNML